MMFEGKTVAITGAAGGIGIGLCRQFDWAGASVALMDLDRIALDKTCDALKAEGIAAEAFIADVSDLDSVRRAVAGTVEAFGSLEVMCCNAAIFPISTIEDTLPET